MTDLRIAVCDDERKFIERFKEIIDKTYKSLDIIIDEFTDGNELIKLFGSRNYDIVFLDIEMPAVDGLTLARKLREMSEDIYIVFLTGHIEYAVKGYEVNALRYLTKPPEAGAVREVIDHVLKKQSGEKALWVKDRDGEHKIKLSDIIYIEAQNQKIVIYTADDEVEVRGKLSDYEEKLLSQGFFRIHRGYLVSLSKVKGFSGRDVTMSDGAVLPVGRTKEQSFKASLMSYVDSEAF